MGIFDKRDDAPESKPDFGNVRSGGSTTAPDASQPTGTIGSEKRCVVVEGDSLSKIAKREYDSRAMINVMTILAKASGGSRQPEFFSTHPDPGNRQERIRQEIATRFPEGVPGQLIVGRRITLPQRPIIPPLANR
jgi:hypothetical protein